MSRKVVVELKVKLVLDIDEGIEISDVISELDYSFQSTQEEAEVMGTDIIDYEVTDSR